MDALTLSVIGIALSALAIGFNLCYLILSYHGLIRKPSEVEAPDCDYECGEGDNDADDC